MNAECLNISNVKAPSRRRGTGGIWLSEVLEFLHVIDKWTKEVTDIAEHVRMHADKIRTKAVLIMNQKLV